MSATPTVEAAPRIPAAQIPSITGLRLSPHGADATLVNISSSGLLAGCALRLKVGSTVSVQFEGTFMDSPVAGRIARCEVSTMGKNGMLMYHIGIDFNTPIDLGDAQPAAPEAKRAPAAMEPLRPRPVAVAPAAAAVRNRW